MRKWNHMSTSERAGGIKIIPAPLAFVKHLTRTSAKANNK